MDFLNHPNTERIIREALKEDIGPGDYTTLSTVPSGKTAQAYALMKDDGIIAGVAMAQKVFTAVDAELEMEAHVADGFLVKKGDRIFELTGDPRSILQAERLVLNIMQRMSGIATVTRSVVDQLEGTNCRVLDTRKTTPLIRHLEKWAVEIGGGVNHRFGLYDMVMIKDNHIDYAGGISAAVAACRHYLKTHNLDLKIEVETRNLEEVKEALTVGGVDRIMLDNMSLEQMRAAVEIIAGRAETEASGNITPERVRAVAETGVDYLSMGWLTHSVRSLDISLKAEPLS